MWNWFRNAAEPPPRATCYQHNDKDTWPTLAKRIEAAGLSPTQVKAVWLKHVEANPKPLGEFPAHARALQADITAILNIARQRYPNLRVAYLSSRTFGGWSGRASGSPEPYAYESGFGTRWVVQSQMQSDPRLNNSQLYYQKLGTRQFEFHRKSLAALGPAK